jgi:glycosyltransferase involved in cell wall biosynthesis
MIGPSNLGPYHMVRFRETVKLIPEFTYLKIFSKEKYRPWSSDLERAPCKILTLQNNENIRHLLFTKRPDIIFLVGYNNVTLLKFAFWAKLNKIPIVLLFDTTYNDHPRKWWKEAVKSLIIKNLFDAAFVSGSRSASYAKFLGINEKLIWRGIDVVDNNHFARSDKKWRPPKSFPPQFFLTVTRLSPEKNLMNLLKAFEIYKDYGGAWGLVIVGTGSLEKELKESMSKKLTNDVFWYGWASYEELPSLYQGASCFILPSISESWGLVVNEAMAAGLPVLVSQKCGCVPELCKEGVNGYSFDPLNIQQLSELMLKMSSSSLDLRSMGEASKKIISKFTPEKWAQTFLEICTTFFKKDG